MTNELEGSQTPGWPENQFLTELNKNLGDDSFDQRFPVGMAEQVINKTPEGERWLRASVLKDHTPKDREGIEKLLMVIRLSLNELSSFNGKKEYKQIKTAEDLKKYYWKLRKINTFHTNALLSIILKMLNGGLVSKDTPVGIVYGYLIEWDGVCEQLIKDSE